MRALTLLIALTAAGTLHATEHQGVLDAQEPPCEARSSDNSRGDTHPNRPESGAVPGPSPASSEAAGNRNRMSQRWHSLLPGMFR